MSQPLNIFASYTSQVDQPEFKNDILKGVVIGEQRFKLNKSESKFVSVGASYDFGFDPCIKLSGNKGDKVIFSEAEWLKFLTYQGIITNYLYYNEKPELIKEQNFSINFDQILDSLVIVISKDGKNIYLAYETISSLWNILPLVEYRVKQLRSQHFSSYFKILQQVVQRRSGGDILENVLNLLEPKNNPNSENVSLMLELVYQYPEVFKQELNHE